MGHFFCGTFNLPNLVKSETCYANKHKLKNDLFLINKPLSSQFTNVIENGLGDID